ncbi:MAG: SDR family oxidoreductase [Bacteroidota bacterium]
MLKEARTVLITGASAGIGAAVADRLAREGYRVFGTTRRLANLVQTQPGLREAVAEAASAGTAARTLYPVQFLELDVTDPDSVQKCVSQVIAEAGKIDVLINNAGWGAFGSVEMLPIETAQRLFDTIVFGTLRMIQAVVPAMRERRDGTVVNISSIAGRTALPFQGHYSAAKAAVEMLSMSLRQELHPFGVRVTVVEPSDINTRFFDQTLKCEPEKTPYLPWSELAWNYAGKVIGTAPPPDAVAKKVARILRRKKPLPIYTAGLFEQRIAPTVFRFCSKRLELRLMRIFYGLGFK